MLPVVRQLTFMAGCLARTPFRTIVKAAAEAGFDSLSVWPNIWRHAMRKDGLSLADMRQIVADHGLTLTDGDACRDWAPPPTVESPRFGPIKSGISPREFLDTCAQLGCTGIVAVHLTDVPLNVDRDTAGFAKLCDEAAEFGLRVGLEFVAFSNIPDVATAWRIIEGAGRKNGGLVVDIWHHIRSTGDDAALARVPADKVFTVQISDGPRTAPADIVDEAMFGRRLPGAGEFNISSFLKLLSNMGVRASAGPELYAREFETRPPVDVMRELRDAFVQIADPTG